MIDIGIHFVVMEKTCPAVLFWNRLGVFFIGGEAKILLEELDAMLLLFSEETRGPVRKKARKSRNGTPIRARRMWRSTLPSP